jgi:hypothetical protein
MAAADKAQPANTRTVDCLSSALILKSSNPAEQQRLAEHALPLQQLRPFQKCCTAHHKWTIDNYNYRLIDL